MHALTAQAMIRKSIELSVIQEVEEGQDQIEGKLEHISLGTIDNVGTDRPSKERLQVVARCAIIASFASFISGINVGFSSPALLELTNENLTTPAQHIRDGDEVLNTFGVSHTCNE